MDQRRRKFLTVATSATAAVGVVFAMGPVHRELGAPPSAPALRWAHRLTVDLSKLEVGQMVTYVWRRQPIYIFKRSPEMVANLAGA